MRIFGIRVILVLIIFNFFTNIRNNKKKIKEFVISSGNNKSNLFTIGKEITQDFMKRFTSNQECFFDLELDFDLIISPIISIKDDEKLIQDVSNEETRAVLFDMCRRDLTFSYAV